MSFKILGASWASYRAVVERTGLQLQPWQTVEELAASLSPLRPFALAATDGNHGKAVARMARLLGFDARIFVPEGTAPARIEAISTEGASVTVVIGDYEDAVARSAEASRPSLPGHLGHELARLRASAASGHRRDSTMFWEIDDRLDAAGREVPDVVVVPVGVGALAAASVNHWCRPERPGTVPTIVGVEPPDANCVMASALAGTWSPSRRHTARLWPASTAASRPWWPGLSFPPA